MRLLRLVLLGALALPVYAAHAADVAGSDSSGSASLAPTFAPPWVPETPVPAGETWESVLRAPGWVVSLPLKAIGRATESGLVYVEESNVLPRILMLFVIQQRIGLAVTPASLGDRTGLGGAVTWTPPGLGGRLAGELSGSTSNYNRERAVLRVGPLSARYRSEWRAQDPFFGIGMDTDHGDESVYAVRSQAAYVGLLLPYAEEHRSALQMVDGVLVNPGMPRSAPARTQLSVWAGPDQAFVTRGRGDDPSIEEIFPTLTSLSLDRRVERLVYGGRIIRDMRYGLPRWYRGWRGAVTAERHDRSIEALALKDAHSDARTFTRLTYEGETGLSVGVDPRSVRLAVRVVDTSLDDAGGALLISDLVSLGGSQGLSGFEAGRFHDLDLVLGRLSYIFPLGKNLEFDWHVEAGGVFPALGDVRPDRLETSYGGMLRVRGDSAMLGQLGVDWCRDGVRFRFSLGDVE